MITNSKYQQQIMKVGIIISLIPQAEPLLPEAFHNLDKVDF